MVFARVNGSNTLLRDFWHEECVMCTWHVICMLFEQIESKVRVLNDGLFSVLGCGSECLALFGGTICCEPGGAC